MDILARAQRIAERLADGRLLKKKSVRMWAGFGNGRSCDGCGDDILGSDVEHEYDLVGGGILRFHAACGLLGERMTASAASK